MKKEITIEVTKEHLNLGERRNPFACPIAIAAKSVYFTDEDAVVYTGGKTSETARLTVEYPGNVVYYKPASQKDLDRWCRFMSIWDEGNSFYPFFLRMKRKVLM